MASNRYGRPGRGQGFELRPELIDGRTVELQHHSFERRQIAQQGVRLSLIAQG